MAAVSEPSVMAAVSEQSVISSLPEGESQQGLHLDNVKVESEADIKRDRSRSPRRSVAVESPPDALNYPLSYCEADPSNWTAKQVGKTTQGAPTVCIYDSVSRTSPAFCMYEKNSDQCGTIVFPLEPHKDALRPCFMTGAEPTRKVEGLDLTYTLEEDQCLLAQKIDQWCKKQALENSKEWFGRACSPTEIEVMYTSPLKIDESGKYPPHIKAKLNLAGIDKYLTRIVLVHANGVPEEGSGWDFVEPRLGEHKWRQHRARIVIEARRIWIVNKRFGLTYSITDLAVREKAEARPNPFTSDSTVEALAALPSC